MKTVPCLGACVALVSVSFVAGCNSHRTTTPKPSQPTRTADDIFSIAPAGSGLRNVTKSPRSAEQLVSVAPNGKTLAFFRHGRLLVRDGQRERTLGRGPSDATSAFGAPPAWSRDGRRLATVRGVGCTEVDCLQYGLWAVDVQTGTRTRVARDGVDPVWLPGGKLTYAGDFRSLPGNPSRTEYDWLPTRYVVGNRHLRAGSRAVPSPRGNLVAYEGDHTGIFVMRLDETHRRRLTADPLVGLPLWSPDGKLLAFPCDYDSSLCVRDIAGRVLRREFGDVNIATRPAWSRDGRFLAWVSAITRNGRRSQEIFVGDVATGLARRVTHFDSAQSDVDSIGWTANRRIVFSGTGIPSR